MQDQERIKKGTVWRIGLWGCSFAVAAALFSLLRCLFSNSLFSLLCCPGYSLNSFSGIFSFIILLGLPAWLLYVPLVIVLRRADKLQIWILLTSGLLIGPVYMAGAGLIVQLHGGDPHMIWYGDGLDLGILPSMPFAPIVGILTSGLYVAGLKHFARLRIPRDGDQRSGVMAITIPKWCRSAIRTETDRYYGSSSEH